jgi:glucose-6-phosphate dehydrogenase assembly protein OpcA
MSVMSEPFRREPERRIPAALVAAFLLQTAGALFWAGSAAERIARLERTLNSDQAAIEKVAVLEEQVRGIKESTDRIEATLDRADTR